MNDIERVLAGRQIVDTYRTGRLRNPEEQPALLEVLLIGLKESGFESIDDFFEKNEAVVLQDKAGCQRYDGACDKCFGREPGCLQLEQVTCYEARMRAKASRTPGTSRLRVIRPYYQSPTVIVYLQSVGFYDGVRVPVFPSCKIFVQRIKEPSLDWFWE